MAGHRVVRRHVDRLTDRRGRAVRDERRRRVAATGHIRRDRCAAVRCRQLPVERRPAGEPARRHLRDRARSAGPANRRGRSARRRSQPLRRRALRRVAAMHAVRGRRGHGCHDAGRARRPERSRRRRSVDAHRPRRSIDRGNRSDARHRLPPDHRHRHRFAHRRRPARRARTTPTRGPQTVPVCSPTPEACSASRCATRPKR